MRLKSSSLILVATSGLFAGCSGAPTKSENPEISTKALVRGPVTVRGTSENSFQIHLKSYQSYAFEGDRKPTSIGALSEKPASLVYRIKNISELKAVEVQAARFDQGYQKIEIIPESAGALNSEKISQTLTINDASKDGAEITLSRNLFEPRGGAKELFAPGSVVADTAYWYVKQKKVSFKLGFKDEKVRRRYSDVELEFSLDADGKLSISTRDLWLVLSETSSPVIKVNAVYPKSDYRFEVVESRGTGKDFEIVMKDAAINSGDDGTSAFEVEVFGRSWMIGKQQHKKRIQIPEEAVKRNGQMITLKLGALQAAQGLFKAGKKIGLKVIALRKVDGITMSQNIRHKAQIPIN